MHDEQCAYNSCVFLKHLEVSHPKTDDNSIDCPNHTCIIKAVIKERRNGGKIIATMYNRILDECGDCDIKNAKGAFVDPALKFFHNVPLMMNNNERIKEELANGTPCVGQYLKLKPGYKFKKRKLGRLYGKYYLSK